MATLRGNKSCKPEVLARVAPQSAQRAPQGLNRKSRANRERFRAKSTPVRVEKRVWNKGLKPASRFDRNGSTETGLRQSDAAIMLSEKKFTMIPHFRGSASAGYFSSS